MTAIADRQLELWKDRMAPLGRLPNEWIGKKPDSMPPPTVRDRIIRAYGGRCALSGVEIRPGASPHMDHIIPLADGGMNAERNFQPVLDKAHRAKTRQENKERAAAAASRRASTGNKAAPRVKIASAPRAPAAPQNKASKPVEKKQPEARPSAKFGFLERRPMFVDKEKA